MAIATTPVDLAGTSAEHPALHDLLHEFKDMFAAPSKPQQSCVKHCIELVDPTKPLQSIIVITCPSLNLMNYANS